MLDATLYAEDQTLNTNAYGVDHIPAMAFTDSTTYFVLPARRGFLSKYDTTVSVIIREDGLLRNINGEGIHVYDATLDDQPAYDLYSYDQNTHLGTVAKHHLDQLPITRVLDPRCW